MDRDQRLDSIDAAQFGLTWDRRAVFASHPNQGAITVGGPLIDPRKRIVTDWTIYIGRQISRELNPTGIYDENYPIRAKLWIGTGQSALEYDSILSVPNVGCCMHFSTQTIKVELSWSQPLIAGSYNRQDQVVTWAAPGRPSRFNVRKLSGVFSPLITPAQIVATGVPIPSFTESVRVRESDWTSTGVAARPFDLAFYTPAGQIVGHWHVNAGEIVNVPIPPSASIVIGLISGLLPASGVLYEFAVNA